MSLEMTGALPESFESTVTSGGLEVTGTGRLRRLAVEFGHGWLTPRAAEEAVGIDVEHESGVTAQVRLRSGQRMRLELSLEAPGNDPVTVPGPVLWVTGERPVIAWHAGASGEIALPSASGPGLLVQRRGLTAPGFEPGMSYPFEEQVTLQPRHLLSAAWTYESFPGDLLDVPTEPSWLPWVRHVPYGRPVEISAPDGMVTTDERCRVEEEDGEFEVYPPEGFSTIGIWGAGGRTAVEIGSYREPTELRRALAHGGPHSDAWCYVALRHLMEAHGEEDDALLDRVDRILADEADTAPTAWTACASAIAPYVGLPLALQAERVAAQVLARGRAEDVLLLAMHSLVPIDVMAGGWPIGDFDRVGTEAIASLGYGRITSDEWPGRGRDVAVAKLFAAGLGESERGLRAAASAQGAEARLLCALTLRPNAEDLAWLSIH